MVYILLLKTVRGVYNHKLAHIDSRERSCCAKIGRPTYAFATLFGPFLLIFVDFHQSRLTSIRSPLKFQNATPHRVLVQ